MSKLPELRINQKINRGYGWKRGAPNLFAPVFSSAFAGELPEKVDLQNLCPPVYDQGPLGSCTAQTVAAHAEISQAKLGKKSIISSRLFLYYNARAIEGMVGVDCGATLTDAVKAAETFGFPKESLWLYKIENFKKKPSKKVFKDGETYKITTFGKVRQDLNEFKKVLAAGQTIIGGYYLYDSFESETTTTTGIVTMPKSTENVAGGHAMLIVGYDDATSRFKLRNSWSEKWGDKGYCYLPYEYVIDPELSSDFWTSVPV